MKLTKKSYIILAIAFVVIIGISYFIYDYNKSQAEAKAMFEKWEQDRKYPWRSYDLTQENAMILVNMAISNSDLSTTEKLNEQAHMAEEWRKVNNR